VSVKLDFKKIRPYITVGLFDQDEVIEQMFDSSVKAVNKDKQKFSNLSLIPQIEEIETNPFEVSLKGKAANEC